MIAIGCPIIKLNQTAKLPSLGLSFKYLSTKRQNGICNSIPENAQYLNILKGTLTKYS